MQPRVQSGVLAHLDNVLAVALEVEALRVDSRVELRVHTLSSKPAHPLTSFSISVRSGRVAVFIT